MTCSCCRADALDIFSDRAARREARRYLKNGLGGADANRLVAWAEEEGLEGASVLEVGGGVGQLQAELVRRGAARGTVVELLEHYAPFADEVARGAGIDDRTSFVVADLTADPDSVDQADVVVLRRVVCCSPHGPRLLAAAAGKARRTVLMSYPRDTRTMRFAARLQNAVLALGRKRFRAFVHPVAQLDHAVREHGFERTRSERGVIWETAAFERR